MHQARGLIFDIRRFSTHDGPGIRTTVFFKGCPLRCSWCHNPESRDQNPEKIIRKKKLGEKEYCSEEIVGKFIAVEEVMKELLKDDVFHTESGGGVTFSGGEPLAQPHFLLQLAEECKRLGLHLALDTCGYAEPGVLRSLLGLIDLYLFDLKLMDDPKHFDFTGVSNRIILQNLALLAHHKKEVRIRFPVISGVNDDDENITAMLDFLDSLKTDMWFIDLLPYHRCGLQKYNDLNKESRVFPEVPSTRLDEIIKLMELRGYRVQTGG